MAGNKKYSSVNNRNSRDINVLSLFSGCGGMDLGFEGGFLANKNAVPPDCVASVIDSNVVRVKPTRFKIAFANDILTEAFTAWAQHFMKLGYNPNIFRRESIVDLVKQHYDGVKVFPENIDIVTGGFPCQDFSVAGKRNGFHSHRDHNGQVVNDDTITEETRGKLYCWMKEVINIVKPKMFIAENVKGLVNLSDVKNIIQRDFSSADDDGYIVLEPKVLHAADYGVPQSRERVIFIGIRKSALDTNVLQALLMKNVSLEYTPYPTPTHSFTHQNKDLLSPVILKDILTSLKEPEFTDDTSHQYYSKARYMGAHCQGQKEINLDGIGPTIRSEHHGNIEYRRLSLDHGGIMCDELQQGLNERRLTPRECALIQTFPSDFEFVIANPVRKGSFKLSPSGAYKVIGNAVPPILAYSIARRIESLWDIYFK